MSSFRRRQAHYTLLRLFVFPLMRDDANLNNITSIGSQHAPDREHSETFLSVQSCQRKSLSCNFSCIAHSFLYYNPLSIMSLKGNSSTVLITSFLRRQILHACWSFVKSARECTRDPHAFYRYTY